MVRKHHTSECIDEGNTEDETRVRIHESLSESMIQNVITKSALEMRTIGDCCARRQSLGQLGKDVMSSLKKVRNRRSDSLLHYIQSLPAEYHRLCSHCNDTGSSSDSTDQGLCFHMQSDISERQDETKKKETR